MRNGFWKELDKPILGLAPMADVTDAPYRKIIAKYGKPSVMYTEFVSCDGLCSVGRDRLMRDLIFDESERPIIAQFFSGKPENFRKCAKLAVELGFDGIDINMGCPDKKVEKQHAGAYLIKDFDLARKIISSTKDGAGELPVSVKTRIGYSKEIIEDWIENLLKEEPAAIAIHARTRGEMSKVPARWDIVERAVKVRNAKLKEKNETLILGNGDIKNINDAKEKIIESGCDGALLGRAIFGNPWLFNSSINKEILDLKEIIGVMIEHAKTFEQIFEGEKNFAIMRKHFGSYIGGFEGSSQLRIKLMEANDSNEVESIVEKFLEKNYVPNNTI